MGIRGTQRAVALAIFGIVISLVLSLLAAAKAPPVSIIACAGIAVILILALYATEIRRIARDAIEDRERWALRRSHGLRVVAGSEADLSPQQLPNGTFGFEEIFAVSGIRSGRARIKPDQANPEGIPCPLEVHKFDGETWLVGYASKDVAVDGSGEVELWMRRRSRSDRIIEISVSRLEDDGESRGDRSWDSSAKNIFRLRLNLKP